MAWNTHQMQATLGRWRAQGRQIDPQVLHHITPMGLVDINLLVASWSSPWSDIAIIAVERAAHVA
jgi:hypothetical protein